MIHKVRAIFGRNNVPNPSNVKRILEKFKAKSLVIDGCTTSKTVSKVRDLRQQTHKDSSVQRCNLTLRQRNRA